MHPGNRYAAFVRWSVGHGAQPHRGRPDGWALVCVRESTPHTTQGTGVRLRWLLDLVETFGSGTVCGAGDLLPYERHAYVTAQLNSFKPDAGTDHFLVCGNPNMINDVYGLLKQKGFKAKQVVREKYVFARQEKVTGKVSLTEAQKQLIAEKLRKYR